MDDAAAALAAARARAERVGAAQLARTRAFGKLIFFGEHFVVYKVPAIVGAVAAYTDCDVELCAAPGLTVVDERPAVPGYKAEKAAEGEAAVGLVLKHLGVDPAAQGLRITFGGTLTAVSGIGASAAQVVSLARAVGLARQLRLTDDDVNAAGFEGERGYHGTPSGIDNTAATFGGLLRFQRTDGAPVMQRKALRAPLRIVFASTGITASTTAVVGDVRRRKEADPAWFDALLAAYVALVARGEAAIECGDMAALGAALNENHALCQQLTVSCAELDALVDAARAAGAPGAKMSGTGRGGLMLALTPTPELQAAVMAALSKIAPQVWCSEFA
jgi:mevalonate kinase